MRLISENIANADSTAQAAGGDPYRRRIVTFGTELDRELGVRLVTLGRIEPDSSAFHQTRAGQSGRRRQGDVKYPNVNSSTTFPWSRTRHSPAPCTARSRWTRKSRPNITGRSPKSSATSKRLRRVVGAAQPL
jgi:hypothetical protein